MTTDSELGIVSANFVRTFIGRQSISVTVSRTDSPPLTPSWRDARIPTDLKLHMEDTQWLTVPFKSV